MSRDMKTKTIVTIFHCAFVTVFFLLNPSMAFAAHPSQKISFKEAIQIAIEKSPIISTSRIEVDLRDLEYSNSYSAFLPSLNFSTTHGLRDNIPSTYNNIYGKDLNLQLTENLYDNGISITKAEKLQVIEALRSE